MNYRDHAHEIGLGVPNVPTIFSKFSSCVIAPGEPVVIPAGSTQVDYEAELAVVMDQVLTLALSFVFMHEGLGLAA